MQCSFLHTSSTFFPHNLSFLSYLILFLLNKNQDSKERTVVNKSYINHNLKRLGINSNETEYIKLVIYIHYFPFSTSLSPLILKTFLHFIPMSILPLFYPFRPFDSYLIHIHSTNTYYKNSNQKQNSNNFSVLPISLCHYSYLVTFTP